MSDREAKQLTGWAARQWADTVHDVLFGVGVFNMNNGRHVVVWLRRELRAGIEDYYWLCEHHTLFLCTHMDDAQEGLRQLNRGRLQAGSWGSFETELYVEGNWRGEYRALSFVHSAPVVAALYKHRNAIVTAMIVTDLRDARNAAKVWQSVVEPLATEHVQGALL